ncbi:thiamine ABC transporter substrate-binding protein [Ornithinimicrobium cryptoxanthini]|uniref:Thiamine ABC transporter substrate-binding protein n=1 Tax=Ornithinimicrobium cryptoxanthini TaxID=2934161 RepID=A0ABY4YH49_9MICO|nr:thiamine ABC transporter substrate-binding protein [Ornithinimicrobium cryptoxanthini]USQ76089.1 thiamine ABC transporter substrate-binding protein [Ornithinimicrobium cryptoxanthini]
MRTTHILACTAALTLGLTGCSLMGDSDDEPPHEAETDRSTATSTALGEVVLVTHDSFTLPDEVIDGFTDETGYDLVVRASGDAGSLTNQLVLTKGSPIGDAVFGIDNTFASRAVDEGVLAAYSPADLPAEVSAHALPGEGPEHLTPVDFGDVCVNIDDAWFEAEGIDPPQTLQDLTDPTYQDLFVTPGASSSSPGLGFLLATIGEFGEDGWQGYWEDLMANGATVTSGWSDAYGVDFTFSGGDRPIVLSYASSPPFTIPEGGDEPTTSALLDTCFRQVEYAGVLEGAENPAGAQALVDYLLSDQVQAAIPDSMYVYPVTDVELPELWAQWAQVADDPIDVDPALIEEHREGWVRQWADIATG